jgi:hypothetical protein
MEEELSDPLIRTTLSISGRSVHVRLHHEDSDIPITSVMAVNFTGDLKSSLVTEATIVFVVS